MSPTSAILAEVCKVITNPVANGYYPVYVDSPRGHAGYCAWHSYGTCNGVPSRNACDLLPTANGNIDVEGIKFDDTRDSASPLGRKNGGSAAAKRIERVIIAEVFFLQSNYQSAANEFREALNGDLQPKWTEVWSHVNLGKIFDITGQRERAVNEYKQAERTKDNTQGALEEAAKYLKTPYERQKKAEAQ